MSTEESAMSAFVALLRGVNVGGNKRVAMSSLRELLEATGFRDGRTLLQSGNLVFRGDAASAAAVERRLERAAAERLGLATDVLVRTAAELEAAIAGNPFPAEAERDPAHLVVMFLREDAAAADVASLQASIAGPELVRAGERSLYLTYPAGIGDSRLTNAVIERALGTRGTARNWNTLRKLSEAAGTLAGRV